MEADVQNTSDRAGDEVVELYVRFPAKDGAPLRALRGFTRVTLAAKEKRHVRFALEPRDVSYVDPNGDRLVSAGRYKIFVGGGVPDTGRPGAEAELTITGEKRLPE